MTLKYYYNLDGIRGIAALIVVVFHFFTYPNSVYLNNLHIYQGITEFGQHGVSLFFVLSGFVITRILLNTRKKKNYFGTFYKRRVLRILPLYYLFLFFYYLITPLLSNTYVEFKLQLPFYFYIQNFTEVINIKAQGPGHYWSLAVEEHFYLLWPLVIFFIQPRHLGKVIGISIVLAFVLKYFMLNKGVSINYFTFTRIDQILMGAYLAVLELNGFFYKKKSLNKMLLIGLTILPIAGVVYITNATFPLLKEMTKYTFLGLFFFSLLGCLISIKDEHIVNRILSGTILQYLGRISYGIYVWHILALILLDKFLITQLPFVDLFFTIGLTIIMAHLSYYYFERFFLKMKDYKFNNQTIFA
ncbi:MAG: acyltransferase, partial [Bacteroidales bacterium]|nr:acyltransferase [Bacteroidales bacterium]